MRRPVASYWYKSHQKNTCKTKNKDRTTTQFLEWETSKQMITKINGEWKGLYDVFFIYTAPTYPCSGCTANALGFSISSQISTERWDPSRLLTSILDVPESVQYNFLPIQSTAIPPGSNIANNQGSVNSSGHYW